MTRLSSVRQLIPAPEDGKEGIPYRHNLLVNSMFRDADTNNIPKSWKIWKGSIMPTLAVGTEGEVNTIHVTTTTSQDDKYAKGILQVTDSVIKSGTTYTLSLYAKGEGLLNFGVHFLATASGASLGQVFLSDYKDATARALNQTTWQRYSFSFTTVENTALMRVMVGSYTNSSLDATIMKPKLEECEDASAWGPAESEIIGEQGPAGIAGPFAFMAGVYDASITYERTDQKMPIVYYDGLFYYPKTNGTIKGETPSATSTKWLLLTQYDIIYAKIMMADFGKLASAIFSGSYMFSQYGTLNGVEVNASSTNKDSAYASFDARNPYDTTKFVPNLLIDFLTGLFHCSNVDIEGTINARHFVLWSKDKTKKGIEMSFDDDGMPILLIYNKNGVPTHNLGQNGLTEMANSASDAEMVIERYVDITSCKTYEQATAASTVTVYRFAAAKIVLSDGSKAYGDNADKNGLYYSTNTPIPPADSYILYPTTPHYFVTTGTWIENRSTGIKQSVCYKAYNGTIESIGTLYVNSRNQMVDGDGNVIAGNENIYDNLILSNN